MKYMMDVLNVTGILPILAYAPSECAVPAGRALLQGGLPILEVMMRSENALDNLKNIIREVPELTVGAGTVLTLEQAKAAIDVGAKFIVLPGFHERIVDFCINNNTLVVPGCVTATELMAANDYGLELIKFFPVHEMGGRETIEALSGPFPQMRFVVTGNLHGGNFLPLLKCSKIIATGGDWMFQEKNALNERDYEQISRNLRNSILQVQNMRNAKL